MSKYAYLAADGGPHLLLPVEAASTWTGITSIPNVTNAKTDYGRAVAASGQCSEIPVGQTAALVFADPPMTAWGKSVDGLVEIYYLKAWSNTNLDALITRASASFATASMKSSGHTLVFHEADAYLLFAGDTPTNSAYGVYRVPIAKGKYEVLAETYTQPGESVTIYRLKPSP